jgi:ribosomal protein S18 acetylase RimI-like enzyme
MITIYHIDEPSRGLDIIRTLFSEYIAELGEDLSFQNAHEDLEDPLKNYGPPRGSLVIAYVDNEAAGCVALQPWDEGVCEMKRLYVRPAFRERHVGDRLVQEILKDAVCIGYKKMVLDTLERLKPAFKLYQKHGFVPTTPYYPNPLPNVVYLEKEFDD